MSFCIVSCSIDLHTLFFLMLRLSVHALLISIALFAVCSCFVHLSCIYNRCSFFEYEAMQTVSFVA